jgi:hypothetical protein
LLNAVFGKDGRREIRQIKGYDRRRPSVNCSGKDVPIVLVGKREARDQGLVTGNQAILIDLIMSRRARLS